MSEIKKRLKNGTKMSELKKRQKEGQKRQKKMKNVVIDKMCSRVVPAGI
jgi:hypothetical protein